MIENLAPDSSDIAEVMAPSLKRCPFCGTRPITINQYNPVTEVYRSLVTCVNHDCNAQVGCNSMSRKEARSTAKLRWETRV